jgi:glutaredoxin
MQNHSNNYFSAFLSLFKSATAAFSKKTDSNTVALSKLFSAAFLVLLFSFSASAGIYRWVDDKGKMHFSDTPPISNNADDVTVTIKTYTTVEVTPLVERLGRDDKVVIYTTHWCYICKKAKNYFRDNKIAYVEYDIKKTRTGRKDYKLLQGKGVPIIIVGDKRMNGFRETRFDALYKQQQEKKQPVDSTRKDS